MDQFLAKKLALEGGLFILENFPKDSEIGIDYKSYLVQDKFKGIKMIPKGLHFIYFSLFNKNQLGLRSGFFHFFDSKEELIKIFDIQNEDLSDSETPLDIINKYKIKNLPYFDEFCAPYPFEEYKKWVSFTDYITVDVLNKLNPKSKKIVSASQIIPKKFVSSKNSMQTDLQNNDKSDLNFYLDPNYTINFTKIKNFEQYPNGSTPNQITQHSIDKSFVFENILNLNFENSDYLLGEFQFSFIVFLVGHVYYGFEQWKKLLRLFCNCNNAINKYQSFYSKLIRVLYHQFQEIPSDLFVDLFENNFLLNSLTNFFLNVKDNFDLNEELKNKIEKFKIYLTKQFDWDFDTEPEDESPIIIQE